MNDELELTSELQPSEDDLNIVREGLLAFNVAHVGRELDEATISIFLRDRAGRIVGGLLGGRRWGWFYIDKLWVEESYRGRGAGSRLLRAAEAEALAAGCTVAVLDTFSFQAPSFYERHGYIIYATLEGFPPGHSQFSLRKQLMAATDA